MSYGDKMNIADDVKKILSGARIPAEYRTSKSKALQLLNVVTADELSSSQHLSALAKWAGVLSGNTATVVSVLKGPDIQTYDLSVPNGHSYVANGIVCHNTTNIPEQTTIDVTKRIYMLGWQTGCKGVTIYRAGSRSGVLIERKKKVEFEPRQAPKRPDDLPCKIHHTNIKNETWTILVGLMDGKPYEIFGGLSKFVEIPKKFTDGIVSKNARKSSNSTYDLRISECDFVLRNIVEQFDNPNYSSMTRMISLALRHGADIQYVVEQLQKDRDSDIFSFAKCIARVLKTYITDGSGTSVIKTCPQCQSTNFAYQENCPTCLQCGWQKCA